MLNRTYMISSSSTLFRIILGLVFCLALSACDNSSSSSSKTPGKNPNSGVPSTPEKSGPQFRKDSELRFFDSQTKEELAKIDIEIAADEATRNQGLMYRKSMEETQGMLFIFPNSEPRFFWMRNTYISLDIIYVDPQKKIVSIAQNTVPFSEAHVPSNDPAMYVVEVLAGYCIRHNINVGDIVTF